MDTFENSFLYISDGLLEYGWEGQYGGIEGLFQKFWTWIYEAVASRVAETTGYQHFIMVNGDDLRIVLLIPKYEHNPTTFKEKLTIIASSFEENYQSSGSS